MTTRVSSSELTRFPFDASGGALPLYVSRPDAISRPSPAAADSLTGAATGPLLSQLAGITEQAGQADAALRDLVSWASWRLLAWMMAVVTSLVLFGWLASTLVLWWDTGTIGAAQVEKARLQAEVAAMQANRDEWAKAGFMAKLERCGPKVRPCVRVDEKAGPFGTASDYRVLMGY